jgi:hypothetical protein
MRYYDKYWPLRKQWKRRTDLPGAALKLLLSIIDQGGREYTEAKHLFGLDVLQMLKQKGLVQGQPHASALQCATTKGIELVKELVANSKCIPC